MRYVFFLFIVMNSFMALANDEDVCIDSTMSGMYTCAEKKFHDSKSVFDEKYSQLINLVKENEEHKDSISKSNESWMKQIEGDCKNYAYFVEEGTITFDTWEKECLSVMYKDRVNHIDALIEMAQSFM